MPRVPIQNDNLASAKLATFLHAGKYEDAARFVRDNNYSLNPALLDLRHADTADRLEREAPGRLDIFMRTYRRHVEGQRELRSVLTDIAKGGAGKLRSETIAELVSDTSKKPHERVDALRAMGGDDGAAAAELVRARHPGEVAKARLVASQAAAARAQVEERARLARSERINPMAKQTRLDAALELSRATRQLEKEHGITADNPRTPAFDKAHAEARARIAAAAERQIAEHAALVDAELVAEGITAPAQPEPPRAA